MPFPLAPLLVASLAQAASLDADVAMRVDSLSSSLKAAHVPLDSRTGWSAAPTGAAILDVPDLRLVATYAPRIWTGDVDARPSPFVDHTVEARLQTPPHATWRAAATAGAARGHTDFRPDPSRSAGASSVAQVTGSAEYESAQGGVAAEVPVGLRTTVSGAARWEGSRTTGLPDQQGVTLDASVARLVTERDSLRVSARANRTVTDSPTVAPTRSASVSAVATWRRRLSPILESWLGGGATWLASDLAAGALTELEPAGELGVARGGEGATVTAEAAVRATTFIDRYTGDVSPSFEARAGLAWRASERLSFGASASGGARTDGVTSMAQADCRAIWLLREALALEVGVTWRGQHEERPERPSFVEAGLFASLAYRRDRIFGRAVDAPR